MLGNDFAQILPVVPRANRAGTVATSLQKSVLWPQFKILLLTTNIRVQDGENNAAFIFFFFFFFYSHVNVLCTNRYGDGMLHL